MLRINYYISGHGYGHATRSAQLISALLSSSPTTHVTVITTAPTHLFPSSPRLSFIPHEVDSAIVQPQPYRIDAAASFAHLAAFLAAALTPAWQARMDAILEATRCRLVLADAPCPLAWAGARDRGVKAILVSNFTFDAIFGELLTHLPAGGGGGAERGAETAETGAERRLVERIEKLYAEFDYAVRLPGHIPFPFVERYWSEEERRSRLVDAPLVFRPARQGREEVLRNLGVPRGMRGWRVLLVQFGGQVLETAGGVKVPTLPAGWICLSSETVADERFFVFPKEVYSPDLVGAADVVLGKIGYGTVSECVGMGTALVYVRRPMFAEEPGLLRYMEENGTCEEISVADYEEGDWAGAIEGVVARREESPRPGVEEGSAAVAKIIEDLALAERGL